MGKRYQSFYKSSLVLFSVTLIIWLLQTETVHESWSESSRLAAVQALVEHGTWRIDASPYGHETGDKLLLDGHYYSDKPPLFAAVGAVFYGLMYHGLGATLAIDGCQPGTVCVYYWLTILMVGLPCAVMAALFYRLARQRLQSWQWAAVLTVLLCFGTSVWPYSLVFNHHLPAAICLFIAFYVLFRPQQTHTHLFIAGMLTGVAVMMDLMSALMGLAFFLIVVIYHRPYLAAFIGGGLIPGLASAVFDYQITGSILPPYFSGGGYDFPGSQFDPTVAGLRGPENILSYSWRNLVGDYGLLAYFPLLILATAGLFYVIWRNPAQLRLKSSLILLAMAGHLGFILTQTNEFGGDAYGGRHFIPFVPILYSFIIFIIPAVLARPGGRWLALGGGLAALLSVIAAYQGVSVGTWHRTSPPFFLVAQQEFPYVTIGSNLAPAVAAQPPPTRPVRHFDLPPISQRLDVNVNNELVLVGYDLPLRRVQSGQHLELVLYWQLLRVVRGDYFVFTHVLAGDQTPQGGLDRRLQEGYPVTFWYPGEVVVDRWQIPVEPGAATGLAWLRVGVYEFKDGAVQPLPMQIGQAEETSVAIGPVLIGTPSQVVKPDWLQPEVSLAVLFGQPGVIALQGYDLAQEEDMLRLNLYWESMAETPVDWTAFIHLQNEEEAIIAQKDGPPGGNLYPTSFWTTGEVIANPVELALPRDLKPGEYTLRVGLYRLDTGQRLTIAGSADSLKLATLTLGERDD